MTNNKTQDNITNKLPSEAPFEIFSKWFNEAINNPQIIEPTAMCLATATKDSSGNILPSARMILLKKFDNRGFCFFTNFTSRKAKELQQNQNVALCIYWGVLGRQVRIEGHIEEVSKIEADEYFASRRRESRIGAWASQQSQNMQNWQEFQDRIDFYTQKFLGQEVPRPEFWSGYRVIPNLIEFWEEGDFRIHKRFQYKRHEEGWIINQLYP